MQITSSKRIFDVTVVLLTSPLWIPILCVVALLVRWKLGSPVLFRQKRPGYREVVFEIIKFRTMKNVTEHMGRQLLDVDRLTPFGRWLRSTSLDELPELINVLKGDMSLVGPRPLLTQYLTRYSPAQRRRHEVRPGLTGLAQIKGRNALTWDEKFAWDVAYVDGHSLLMDLSILSKTISAVVLRRGISAQGEATMTEFDPSKSIDSGYKS